MEISIYGHNGTLKMTVPPGSGSRCITQLQGDSELSLSFDYYEYVALDVNDYVDFLGARYRLLEQYRPKEVSTVHWKYDVRLYGIESLIKRYLVIEHTDGDANPVFTLTAPASQHIRMIAECLNSATGTSAWGVGSVVDTGNITIDYEGKYCDEGLRELAEAAGTEYWFSGRLINLCRCEHGTALQLGYGNGLISLERDVADNAKFYTRLYPVGSSRNINPETYGHKRLQLPNGRKYVDLDVDKYGVIDHYEQDAFSKIYPRYMGTVGSVRVEERTSDEGTVFQVYYIKDNSLPFDPNNYLLPNEKIRVSFQTGDMQGLGETDDHYFEADYNSTTGEYEIMNIWTDGEQLPRAGLAPAVGDQYIPWNISMPDTYIRLAEQEYKAAVDDYNQKHFVDVSVYRGDTDHTWVEANSDEDISVGRRVRLSSSQYFPSTGYRDSRIVKVTRRLDLPSQMELEISDAVSTGTLTKINDALKDIAEDIRTGDSAFYDFLKNRYSTFISAIKNQVDGKAETWISSSDPSLQWNTNDMRDAHVGDMWLNSSSGTVAGVPPMATAIYTKDTTTSPATYSWVVDGSIPNDVFDTIDGKASIYTNDPTDNDPAKRFPTNYQERDLWILGADFTINGIAYKKGTILTASADSVTYNEAHWTELVRYTDDSVANEIITKYGNILGITSPTAENVGEAVGYLSGILNHPAGTTVAGGLVLTSLIAMRGTESTPLVWGGMNGTYLTDESGTSPYRYKGHGIAAWYGGAMVDKECISPAPAESSWNTYKWARSLFRFDGSGYVANGNISWDKDGTPSIKGNVIDTTTLKIGGTTVNLSDYVTLATAQTITGLKTFNNKIKIGDVYLEWESANNALKVYKMSGSSVAAVNLYATGGVSAFGLSTSGGGVTLNQPLASINNLNANPTSANKTLVWNGSAWTYGSVGSGAVSSITVGTTNYSPVGGVVTLPEYATASALSGYLPLTGGTMSNTNVVTNLNADLLDGKHSTEFAKIYSGRIAAGKAVRVKFGGQYNAFIMCRSRNGAGYLYLVGSGYGWGTARNKWCQISDSYGSVFTWTVNNSSEYPYSIEISSSVDTTVWVLPTDNSVPTFTAIDALSGTGANNPMASVNDNVASATKLKTARTLWGQSFDGTANVSGSMSDVGNIYLDNGSILVWKDSGGTLRRVLYFDSSNKLLLGERTAQAGYDTYIDGNNIYLRYGTSATNGITLSSTGATTISGTLSVANAITLSGNTAAKKRIYFGDTSHYIELDSTGFHFSHGLYSDSFVSAFGASTGGGGITLNQPLSSINSLNANPSASGKTLVWNGSAWTYADLGSGSVGSIVVNGTSYSSVNGVVTLPDYPSDYVTLSTSQTITGLKTMTHGLIVSGRVRNSGDDEGIVVGMTGNFSALCLGSTSGIRSVFYLYKNASDVCHAFWKFNDGTASYEIYHPKKDGTIALISDVPTNNNQLTNGAGYITSSGSCASATKLATPRSIWGQSFDGSDNITGTIYLTQNTPHYFRDPNNAAWRGGIYWGTRGKESMSFVAVDSNTKFQFVHGSDIATWTNDTHATATSSMTILSSGVGIGTNSPSYKLDVNGTFYASGNSSIGGTLGVIGATTLSSTLSVSSNTTIGGTLSVTGAATLGGNLSMPSNGRITQGSGVLYLGTSNNAGWVYTQDIASQSGSTIWNIRQTGSATFQSVTIGSAVLSWDSTNSCLKISTGMYSDSFISAFGASSGGSSLSLNGVLSSINSSSLAAPSATGQTVVWDGSTWQYSTTSNVTLKADKIYAANGITISSGSLSLSNGSISLPGYINAYGNIITNSKIAIGYSSVSSSYQFYCKNNGYISGTLTQGSDIRRKNIVGDVDMLDINNVASAPIFRFTWKDRDDPHIYAGTSAQYWQDKLPETVLSTDEGYLSMDYGATALIATILTARKVVEHERRIRDLETENERLRKEINELKAA